MRGEKRIKIIRDIVNIMLLRCVIYYILTPVWSNNNIPKAYFDVNPEKKNGLLRI